MIISSYLRFTFPKSFSKLFIDYHSFGKNRIHPYNFHCAKRNLIKSTNLFAKDSKYQVRWLYNEKNNSKDKDITRTDELIQTTQQIAEDAQDKISNFITSLKYDSRNTFMKVIRSGIMGSIAGIIIGSCIFLFSVKSFTFILTGFAASTVLMTCLGLVKGISRITDNITNKDGPLHHFLSFILEYAFEPLKETEVGDKIIPIEEYNNAVQSTLNVVEEKLSMGNWFVKRLVRLFTSRIGASFTKFTQGKEDVCIGDSKDMVISIILDEIEGIIGSKISYAIYAISSLQLIIIILSFV